MIGLEHHALPQLQPDIPSGTKLLVKGPVEVTNATLLLKSENVYVLGGAVEEMERKNQQLRAKINEPTRGKPHRSWKSGEEFLASIINSIEQTAATQSEMPPPPNVAALPTNHVDHQPTVPSFDFGASLSGEGAPTPRLAPPPAPASLPRQEDVIELVDEVLAHADVYEERENSAILICDSPISGSLPQGPQGTDNTQATGRQLLHPPPPPLESILESANAVQRGVSPSSRKRKVSEVNQPEQEQASVVLPVHALGATSRQDSIHAQPRMANLVAVQSSENDPMIAGPPLGCRDTWSTPGAQQLPQPDGPAAAKQGMGGYTFLKPAVNGGGYTFVQPYTYLYCLSTFASTAIPECFPIDAVVNGHVTEIIRTQSVEDFFSRSSTTGQRQFVLRGVIEDGTMRMTVQFKEQLIWKLAGRQAKDPLNADVMYNLLTNQNSQRQGMSIIGTCIKKLAAHVGLIKLHTPHPSISSPMVTGLMAEPLSQADIQALRLRMVDAH